MKNLKLIILLVSLTTIVQAQESKDVVCDKQPIDTMIVSLRECMAVHPQLKAIPEKGGTGWVGGYIRAGRVENTLKCTEKGSNKEVYRTESIGTIFQFKDIRNPNLEPGQPSYVKRSAPLTDDELQVELAREYERCLSMKTGTKR